MDGASESVCPSGWHGAQHWAEAPSLPGEVACAAGLGAQQDVLCWASALPSLWAGLEAASPPSWSVDRTTIPLGAGPRSDEAELPDVPPGLFMLFSHLSQCDGRRYPQNKTPQCSVFSACPCLWYRCFRHSRFLAANKELWKLTAPHCPTTRSEGGTGPVAFL